ncbi:hypothetical protein SDC9_151846 [bioreactor metagenome]|uniref:Uncharacterized protein n=1 Tax=bioreactor metagenome TaxID=1076179 RepID=A0A645EVR6_9ZZZZ
MIPPDADSFTTAISVVGVVAIPTSTTSQPIPVRVPVMILCTILPDIRASLPTTIFGLAFPVEFLINRAYADANFTMSTGVRLSPTRPPIVPLIPDMDLISVIALYDCDSNRY